ncbi:MAG TPA: hypothetical protein VMV36_01565 [Ignavibacteriaceae bacterium]|nr:hypothetical protein [Ignavibacteriaceae bacterium]
MRKSGTIPAVEWEKAAAKKAKLQGSEYLTGEAKRLFIAWLWKKAKYKLNLTERELGILKSLDRIKKIKRVGSFRIYKFISSLQNKQRSFYLVLNGYGGNIETVKNEEHLYKFKEMQAKTKQKKAV